VSKTYRTTKSYIFLIFLYLSLFQLTVSAQQQSGRVYEFLNLSSTARITAAGGYAVPGLDNDLGMALFYPSLNNTNMVSQLSLNFVDYFGDISYGTVGMNRSFEKAGNFAFSVQYIDYGVFSEADELGNQLADFSAGEYAISVGWGRNLTNRLSIGSNLKTIFSNYEQYSSFGLAVDVSVSYLDPERMVGTSLVIRNIGRQITKYNDGGQETLPFDIVLGISKKLINAPLRFSMVAHNLHRYDLTYDDFVVQETTFIGTENQTNSSRERFGEISDKILRHTVFGVEFTPTPNFTAGIGYNYRRRQEMKVDTRLSTVGLSWGIGIKISHFRFHYGRANYHLAGAPNHFSVSTNLESLFFGSNPKPSI
jgi:hypothetical protein